jgi:putative restriction endonuclease
MKRDLAVRLGAFEWLSEKTQVVGDVLPRKLLQEGFVFEGSRIPLVSPQGIFRPKGLDVPLSITTTPEGPYHDAFGPDGWLAYRYRGVDPQHPDNVGLRKAKELQWPLIYFHGIVPGRYLAVWPVFVIADDPSTLTFSVAVDEAASIPALENVHVMKESPGDAKRAYITSMVRVRLHQRSFRERVVAAYRSQCALCRLRHDELLDAAHIIPDTEPAGEPQITNGIALCKLHHAAFDSFIIGLSPDYRVHVRPDVLVERDGPVLEYALQGLHKAAIILPPDTKHWPNRESLERRFEKFRAAG